MRMEFETEQAKRIRRKHNQIVSKSTKQFPYHPGKTLRLPRSRAGNTEKENQSKENR